MNKETIIKMKHNIELALFKASIQSKNTDISTHIDNLEDCFKEELLWAQLNREKEDNKKFLYLHAQLTEIKKLVDTAKHQTKQNSIFLK